MRIRLLLAMIAVAAVVAAVALWRIDPPQRRLVVHFTEAVGVYAGSDVRVLGVRVGEVTAVVPEGTSVRVELRYGAGYPVPADAQAVIVPPSVVSDRYVQLTPAYTGGPVLADGAELPTSRTSVPLEIERIWLEGWTARVRVRVADTVHLPDNATAAIRQSSLLGEKFVDLAAPVGEAPQGELFDGDVIPLIRTRRAAEVEELLGALGLVLIGGGLAQLRIINAELATGLEGNETHAREALRQLDTFVGGLDAQRAEIVQAIDALDRLTTRLASQRETIGDAVDSLGPGLAVLADQRQQLTGALTALRDLGTVGRRVIEASRDDLLASIAALRPILDQLVQAGDALPKALDFLLTFPFPPNVTDAIVGDRVNLWIMIDADASEILANLLAAAPLGSGAVPDLPVPSLPIPSLPSLPLPLPSLPLPTLPPLPLPTLPSLPPPSLPLGQASGLVGQEIVRGSAPPGAADGARGSLWTVLSGGLTA